MDRVVTDARKFSVGTLDENRLAPPRDDIVKTPTNICTDYGKFIERGYQNGNLSYERKGSDPGKLIIFNYEFVNTKKYRAGSRRDVLEIITVFQRLGFNIYMEDIHTDLSSKEVMTVLDEVVTSDLSQSNSLILFFLTHGNEQNFLETTDGEILVEDIYNKFSTCKDLKNKPKMFVFQACKGSGKTTTTGYEIESSIVPANIFKNHIPPDTLLLFSSIEGNVSYRTAYGSWFIQELCKNFHVYGRRDDVTSLVTRTIKCVCGNYYYHDEGEDMYVKQMPLMVSTLKRKFYLNTNKERHILIKISEDLEKIKIKLKNMELNKNIQ